MSRTDMPLEPDGVAVVLVGFMGAGKSTVGRALAVRCGVPFVDCDEVIEREHGPISAIFAAQGEAGFRALEEAVVLRVLAEAERSPCIVALGGGAVSGAAVRARLADLAQVVWLQAPVEDLWIRTGAGESDARPLARDRDAFARLLERREALYAEVARVCVAGGASQDVDTVVDEIVRRTGLCARPGVAGR